MTTGKKCVVDYLRRGQENAIPARTLADAMGIKDTRYLRILVEHERRNGAVILSSTDRLHYGYYLAADQAEVDRYIARQSKRAKSTWASIKSAKRYRRLHQPGQLYIADMAHRNGGDNTNGRT